MPEHAFRVTGGWSNVLVGAMNADMALAVEGKNHRISGRWVQAKSYRDARGRSFGELYGYATANVPYRLQEFSLTGVRGLFSYGGQVAYAQDIPFPYLLMDERSNMLAAGFLQYGQHKLYANYTHHLMNNGLRETPMFMETDARNLTLGLTDGQLYEIFYRRWDAWNTMQMMGMNNQPMRMRQHMIPELHQGAVRVGYAYRRGALRVRGKIGVQLYQIGDEGRLPVYQEIYPSAKARRWFVPFGVIASVSQTWHQKLMGAEVEVASEAPAPELLYLSVKGMMNNSMARVFRYVNLTAREHQNRRYTTFTNIDALLISAQLSTTTTYARAQLTYTYGQNLTDNRPLPEIMPLEAQLTLQTPRWHGVRAWVNTRYVARQSRVDETLNEQPTPAFHRVDAGVEYTYRSVQVALEGDNLTNALYYTHLSYLRDPFNAGRRVYEPERTVRFKVRFTY